MQVPGNPYLSSLNLSHVWIVGLESLQNCWMWEWDFCGVCGWLQDFSFSVPHSSSTSKYNFTVSERSNSLLLLVKTICKRPCRGKSIISERELWPGSTCCCSGLPARCRQQPPLITPVPWWKNRGRKEICVLHASELDLGFSLVWVV